jgi:ubiquinone biosynthesis protein
MIMLPGASRMTRPELEPTRLALGNGEVREPIQIAEALPGSGWNALTLLLAFAGLLFRTQWWRLIGKGSPRRTGIALRELFERHGGLWMKFGQLMSLRRDVLPLDLCDELAELQHRAIGFPPEQAMRAVEEEIGHPIETIFSRFDPKPFAAASLSQVHLARLRDSGTDVVVKVLRPGTEGHLQRDLGILRFIFRRLNCVPRLRRLRLLDALGELEQIVLEETDYRYEANNMRELRKTTRGHKVYIARVYQRYSTKNVLVMEYISGVLMSDYIRIRANDPDRVDRWLEANNIDPKKVARRLLISFMRQLFENNLFHADLHPGNIILLRDSRVALIDLGSVGSLDREFLALYRGIQRALSQNDFGKAADLQLRLCAQLPSRHLPKLRRELTHCLRIWSRKTKLGALPFRERSVNTGAAEVSRILHRYGAQQTWEFLRIARTLSTLDASLEELHPRLDYIAVLKRYFHEASPRAIRAALKPANITRGITQVTAAFEEYHLMMAPGIRSNAFNFEATISKVSRVFALLARLFGGFVLVITAGFVYKFLRNHAYLQGVGHGNLFDRICSLLPDFDVARWGVIIVACLVVLIVIVRIHRELLRPDPGTKRRS